ncbi:MAG: VapC toxin family PIN domain ribonuclease [Proteobacteria bacterium]|nr:MAG: VapC toxin family PIN domain ribonuclease [Pseudomonadota bacterium]
MRYLLDTNICIYIINKSPIGVLKKLNEHKGDEIFISTPSVSELFYGVENSKQKSENSIKLSIFLTFFENNILPFDEKSAKEYGKIRAYINQNNKKQIGDKDMDIASIAISNKSILVTNNQKGFEFIPNLKIENWA